MRKYESFAQYLTLNYLDVLQDGLAKFLVLESKKNYKSENNQKIKIFVELSTVRIIGVEFTKSELDYVEFEVYIRAKYFTVINNNFEMPMRIPGEHTLFSCGMKGNFSKGFEIGRGKVEKICKEPFVERLTKALVPVINKEKMELYATKFLRYYCPEALKVPMALDLTKILNDKGITWHSAPLTSGVFGKTYFADDVAEVYDSNKNRVRITVKRGTILINTIKADERGDGALRNTIVHEAVHWFFHNNYFALRHLLNNKLTCSICYRSEHLSEDDEIKWMESQARSLAPKILMPKVMFLRKFKELYKKNKKISKSLSNLFGMRKESDILFDTVIDLANFFEVSKQSVKYRLIELGYFEADGVANFNSLAKKYYETFMFDKNKLKEHQTFYLPQESFISLLENDSRILIATRNKKLLYLNGLLVVNNPKYVVNEKLTDYAISHVDECCVIFNVKSDHKPFKDNFASFSLCAGGKSKAQAQIDDEHYAYIIQQANENAEHYEAHKKNLPSTFGETIEYHCVKFGQSYEWISDVCDLTATTLRKFRNEDFDDIKLTNIIKFGLGLKLSQPYIQDIINKAGISMTRISKQNSILLTIIMTFQRLGIKKAYKILKINGNEKYLKLSKRYLKKYKL